MFSLRGRMAATGKAPSEARHGSVATPHPWRAMRASRRVPTAVSQGFKLMEMPLDIILEVFAYLHPMDLLTLARTYKQLRNMLMTKHSKAVWRIARGNIEGLPDCPVHLSEPAYANLAFDPHCHKCLVPDVYDVFWELSARYCTACLTRSSVEVLWTDAYAETYILSSLRFTPNIDLGQYLPSYTLSNENAVLFNRSDCVRFAHGLKEARANEAAMKAYLEEVQDRTDQIRLHADDCSAWYIRFLETRLSDIVVRLMRERWARPILEMLNADNYNPLAELSVARHPRVLTDDEWKEIRSTVVRAMNEYHQEKLQQKRRDTTVSRLRILRETYHNHLLGLNPHGVRTRELDFGPRFADIAVMPELRALVESATNASIHEDTFKSELVNLPALAGTFNFQRELALSDMMAQALGCQTWIGILDLAVAWFHCEVCEKYVRSPEVLAHLCQRPYYGTSSREDWAPDTYPYDVAEVGGFHAWSSDTLRPIEPEDLVNLRGLIAACGLDPETTKAEEMDALDFRFTYKKTSAPARETNSGQVMNWRRAVLSLPMMRDDEAVQWTRLSEVAKRATSSHERIARKEEARQYKHTKFLWCALCDEPWWLVTDVHWDPFLIACHLRRSHHATGSAHELEEQYMYLHPDGDIVTPAV